MNCNYPGCEKQREPDHSYGPLTCKEHAASCCDGTGVEPARNHDDPKWCPCSGCDGKGYLKEAA